tara:strand:+ start:126 stop:605 length:480 start_codon:yes stop_codon:yes gene_type:complete
MYPYFMKYRVPFLGYLKSWLVCLFLTGCGGGGNNSDKAIPDIIPSPNKSPTLTLNFATSLPENQIRIGKVTVTDPDGDDISLTLSGDDSVFLNLEQDMLLFKRAPDFEDPVDTDFDNVFVFDVTASDGALSVSKAVEIEVFNVSERKYDEAIFENDSLE